MADDDRTRCGWNGTNPLYVAYHDDEWGVPERDDRALFEKLCLDGFQAGLSWWIILKKRAAFREAFAGFDPAVLAGWGAAEVEALMANAAIVRNRRKIEATLGNARAYLALVEAEGSFADFLWRFVGGQTVVNRWRGLDEMPAETEASRAMSRALREKGFRFVGPTICYAVMQAVGMVNDHLISCFRHAELAALAAPPRT